MGAFGVNGPEKMDATDIDWKEFENVCKHLLWVKMCWNESEQRKC